MPRAAPERPAGCQEKRAGILMSKCEAKHSAFSQVKFAEEEGNRVSYYGLVMTEYRLYLSVGWLHANPPH